MHLASAEVPPGILIMRHHQPGFHDERVVEGGFVVPNQQADPHALSRTLFQQLPKREKAALLSRCPLVSFQLDAVIQRPAWNSTLPNFRVRPLSFTLCSLLLVSSKTLRALILSENP